MAEQLSIPNDKKFLTDLILQRTGPFLRHGGGGALNRWFTHGDRDGLSSFLEERNLVGRFLTDVFREVAAEAESLSAMLPVDSLDRIVSIGPGNGLLELMLLKKGATSQILLIDIEHTAEHHHGFNSSGSGYATLATTKSFLVANGVKPESVGLCNPRKEPLPAFRYSSLISLLSMGFHYPCDEYVEFIQANAGEGALIVFDKRKDVPDSGYDALCAAFGIRHSLDTPKSCRVFLAHRQA